MLRGILVACLLATGCATTEYVYLAPPEPPPVPPTYGDAAEGVNRLLDAPFDETRAVEVYYATNRSLLSERGGCGAEDYGNLPDGATWFGRCLLNVPKLHEVGAVPMASSPRDDPNRFYRALRHVPMTQLEFRAAVQDSAITDVLVLVHGFNVEFEEALFRAAQIAYDLKFQGRVVLYSWPAGARSGFSLINRTYARNRENAAASVEEVRNLLGVVAQGPATPHLLVHSMGHQLVVPALEQLASKPDTLRFGEIIFNAPDIDLDEFREAVPVIVDVARRVTVYCSYNDNAIAASEVFNEGRRLGACEGIEGVDVINVGEIDAPALGVAGLGHSYYASRPILTDVFQVLLGIEASRRLFMRRSEPNSTEDFYLRR